MNIPAYAPAAAALLGIFVLDAALGTAARSSLLPAILFWTACSQGAVALAAAAELSHGRWIRMLRSGLLRFYPLQLLSLGGFIVFSRHLAEYPWHAHPTAWLSPTFTLARIAGLLLLTALAAHFFARAAAAGSRRTGVWATLYLLCFVVTQTLIGIDWVMSFEYPWVSTLFGAYFFIEAMYLGIALAAILAALSLRSAGVPPAPAADPALSGATDAPPLHADETSAPLRNTATLLYGFSLLWGGQLFAQYLTIWYGNIPEEVEYLYNRVMTSPLREMSVFVVLAMFAGPFILLMSGRAKRNRGLVIAISGLVAAGYVVEKLVFLIPATRIQPALAALQFVVFGVPFVYLFSRQSEPVPATAPGASATGR